MGIKLHSKVPPATRVFLKFLFVTFCVAVLVDIDHIIDGHRGCLHEPLVLLVAWIIFVVVALGSRLFRARVLKAG